jgi:hypothetical protein
MKYTQVPSKHEALSSNPSAAKKQKTKKPKKTFGPGKAFQEIIISYKRNSVM